MLQIDFSVYAEIGKSSPISSGSFVHTSMDSASAIRRK